jgi:tRNA(Ile)-lysidine synthase
MRNFRPGDRFFPLGAEGKQKLKDFFIDHKIPKLDRPKVPLLISGEIIAWVVGFRIDERVKITEKTNRVLKIKVV